MPVKKRRSPSRQLKQLRDTVSKLRADLAQEARRRKQHVTLAKKSEKARKRVVARFDALRKRGIALARQLREALGDANRRQRARDEATAKLAELRRELSRKTDELRRKSAELGRLARESAEPSRTLIEEPRAAVQDPEPQRQNVRQEPKEPAY